MGYPANPTAAGAGSRASLVADAGNEIAQLEGLDNSYISRMVNLTTLAPDIVEAILDDCLPPNITLFDLAVDPPRLWSKQREKVKFNYWR
ncbi:hypothetical protein [Hahella ganghwensis]|uniref:hypothetical protein n=1 Tax=Hahella ganghwensis TaxID=286420 RepID=UPI001FDFA23F|nr:hypothetical protein [Hahella ganghwensis]